MNLFDKGLLGERKAARYLRFRGMKILKRRWRTAHGEIDLICRDGETIVFVEVKYRPRGKMGDGLIAITSEKRRHLRYAASIYLMRYPGCDTRFDVIEISAEGIQHLKNAF